MTIAYNLAIHAKKLLGIKKESMYKIWSKYNTILTGKWFMAYTTKEWSAWFMRFHMYFKVLVGMEVAVALTAGIFCTYFLKKLFN